MKNIFFCLFVAAAGFCSAQGSYLEFKMSGGNSSASLTGGMKIYSQDGNSRTEMQMNVPKMPGGAPALISLYLKSEPQKVYMLDDKTKSYNEMQIGNSTAKSNTDYEITIIGKETVNGYNSTHVKMKGNSSMPEMEMWTSTEVPNYKDFERVKSKFTNDGLFKALAAKGAEGFPVRIIVSAAQFGMNMQLDLVKAETRNNPSSLFSLDGYTKSTTSGLEGATGTQGTTGTPNMQDLMQKMQNMTPEQRQEMINQLKQQYGGSAPH